jgi:hypothetical protein
MAKSSKVFSSHYTYFCPSPLIQTELSSYGSKLQRHWEKAGQKDGRGGDTQFFAGKIRGKFRPVVGGLTLTMGDGRTSVAPAVFFHNIQLCHNPWEERLVMVNRDGQCVA